MIKEFQMKRTNLLMTLLCISVGLLISSCSTIKGPEIVTKYEAKDYAKPINSFLVIGVGKDKDANKQFERLLVKELETQGVKAFSSIQKLPDGQKLSKESATEMVKKLNVQGILVTRLLGSKLEIEQTEKRTEVKIERPQFEKFPDFFVYEYTQIHSEKEFDISATVVLATDLFTSLDGSRVLSLESTSFNKKDAEPIISETITGVVSQLKRDKVIQ